MSSAKPTKKRIRSKLTLTTGEILRLPMKWSTRLMTHSSALTMDIATGKYEEWEKLFRKPQDSTTQDETAKKSAQEESK